MPWRDSSSGGADARAHQDQGRGDGARGEHDRPGVERPPLAADPRLDAGRPALLEDHALDEGVGDHARGSGVRAPGRGRRRRRSRAARRGSSGCCARAPPCAGRCGRPTAGYPASSAARMYASATGCSRSGSQTVIGPGGAVMLRRAARERLGAQEVGAAARGGSTPGPADLRPGVEVGRVPADVGHGVELAGAAQHAAARPGVDPPGGPRLRRRPVGPVEGPALQVRPLERVGEPGVAGGPARLDQADPPPRVLAEPRREDAARRTAADDQDVGAGLTRRRGGPARDSARSAARRTSTPAR